MASVYEKAYETFVEGYDGQFFITQDSDDTAEDVIQLNADQAQWLIKELQKLLDEDK